MHTLIPVILIICRHHTVRVFISSTFRDMHGERDLLTRFVFPELRAKARTRFVNLYEVDLRWGVSEEQTKHSRYYSHFIYDDIVDDDDIELCGHFFFFKSRKLSRMMYFVNWLCHYLDIY